MRYAFIIYLEPEVAGARPAAEVEKSIASHAPYIERLRANRQYVAGDALEHGAHTLRTAGGKPVTTQGPFVESREQVGGYYIVDARDLDEAIELAAACPALRTVGLAIEIRPLVEPYVEVAQGRDRRMLLAFGAVEGSRWQQLAPPGSATTVRLDAGNPVLADGPFDERRAGIHAFAVTGAEEVVGADAPVEVRRVR
jgi:hypothetical protein